MTLKKLSLSYQIAPFDMSGTSLLPCLILLHGRGADEEDLLGLAPYFRPGMICIAPRAPFPFSFGGYMWYTLDEIAKPDEKQFRESYDRLSSFIDEVPREYPVDPRRMYLLGFSMGTVMAYALALTRPDRVRGVVAHSGYIPEHVATEFQWQKLSHTSFFVAHGDHDPVIPVEFARRAKELLAKSNAQVLYREYPMQHQISEESLHDLSEWLANRVDSPSP